MNPYNPYTLAGKTIFITGASSGIGRETAIQCSKLGAQVICLGRNQERLAEVEAQLEGDGHSTITADLTDFSSLKSLVKQLPETIDGFVSNAGISSPQVPVQFYKKDDMVRLMETNLYAHVLLTKELLKQKKLKRNSSVVFTSSIGGVYGHGVCNGMYDMTKCGLDAFMKTAALEWGPKGVRFNSVNPGMVHTPLIKGGTISDEQLAADEKLYPLRRYGNPIDIALPIAFLLSDAASWITGTALKVDGGKTI